MLVVVYRALRSALYLAETGLQLSFYVHSENIMVNLVSKHSHNHIIVNQYCVIFGQTEVQTHMKIMYINCGY